MPKVSVIIPAYNTKPYLRRCLDSVVGQTLRDIEIICVNDGSTDGSLAVLREYEQKDGRVKVIDFAQNRGVAVARNAAMDAAAGEYIGFVDSDDYVDLDFYEQLYRRATEENADVAKGNMWVVDLDGEKKDGSWNTHKVKEIKEVFTHAPTAVYRRAFLSRHALCYQPGLTMLEDTPFETKVGILSNKIEVVDNVYYYYVRRVNSIDRELLDKESVYSIIDAMRLNLDFINSQKLDHRTKAELLDLRYYNSIYIYPTRIKDE
jgi:glycosyltransferase involved in cell wall biosynthesis